MTVRCVCLANVIRVGVIKVSVGLVTIGGIVPTVSLAQLSPAPVVGNPAVGNPAVGNPAVGNPAVGNPAVDSPALNSPVPNDPLVDGDRPIVLGQPRNAPYIVAIPGADVATLLRVQRYIPTAFITDSRYGSYIQAGAFSDRAPAEERSRGLRGLGFDARVAYFPVP